MRKMLMPIRPDWVEKILSGEKTVELRKRLPDLEKLNWKEPFQVIVYCSQRRKLWTAEHGNIAGKVVAKIKAHADELHKKLKGSCVCVPPDAAENIIRECYGLPAKQKQVPAAQAAELPKQDDGLLDLDAFL